MTIKVNGLTRTCTASNLYDLGGAHSVKTADTQAEFNNRIRAVLSSCQPNIMAYTNSSQSKTREYMKALGIHEHKTGGLWIHFIDKPTLKNNLKDFEKKEAELRKNEVERIKRLIEERKAKNATSIFKRNAAVDLPDLLEMINQVWKINPPTISYDGGIAHSINLPKDFLDYVNLWFDVKPTEMKSFKDKCSKRWGQGDWEPVLLSGHFLSWVNYINEGRGISNEFGRKM